KATDGLKNGATTAVKKRHGRVPFHHIPSHCRCTTQRHSAPWNSSLRYSAARRGLTVQWLIKAIPEHLYWEMVSGRQFAVRSLASYGGDVFWENICKMPFARKTA